MEKAETDKPKQMGIRNENRAFTELLERRFIEDQEREGPWVFKSRPNDLKVSC
jgi:hypothetical protein